MKTEELIKHIEHYAKTKTIADELVRCYDQCGRWRDNTITLAKDVSHSPFSIIRKSILPESRRTALCRHGTVLLTSYVSYGKPSSSITHCEIRGNMIIGKNSTIYAPNLMHVGGTISADQCKRLYLPQLTSVGGSLNAVNVYSITVPRLCDVGGDLIVVGQVPSRIETVGGRFGVYWLFDVKLPRLRRVGGALVAPKAEMVVTPVLEKIGGGFLLGNLARRVQAPQLAYVGGDFLADAVRNLRAPWLRVVGGNLDTRSAVDFFHTDLRVLGVWTPHPDACANWHRRESARQALKGHTGPILL